VRETENMVKNHKENPAKNLQTETAENFTKIHAQSLKELLPFTHKLKAKSIEISFSDEEELKNFLTFLNKH
jgi:ParB family chromosome partitioning protein